MFLPDFIFYTLFLVFSFSPYLPLIPFTLLLLSPHVLFSPQSPSSFPPLFVLILFFLHLLLFVFVFFFFFF